MTKSRSNRLRWVLFVGGAIALIVLALRPTPLPVETAAVTRGSLEVTVDDDGRTRVRDRFIVSAPIAGRVRRIALRPGDSVEAGRTVVAVMAPADPQLLDARSQAESLAREKASEASRSRAVADHDKAEEARSLAESEFERTTTMFRNGVVSRQEFDNVEFRLRSSTEDLRSAEFAIKVTEFELEQARAALRQYGGAESESGQAELEILSPIDGVVLKRFQESAMVLASGAPLLELGDASNLEIEIDVLSSDAVRVKPGARVWIEHWGGEERLEARVRIVEPSAFTKISPLGVEEQRVWVIGDPVSSTEQRARLGDGYRVEARIVVAEASDRLLVPSSSLFRLGDSWAVFVVTGGRAEQRRIDVGLRNDRQAVIEGGLAEGEQVVLYPGDQLTDGAVVEAQEP